MRSIEPGLSVWDKLRTREEYEALDDQVSHLQSLDLATASDRELKAAVHAAGAGYVTRAMYIRPESPFTTFRVSRPTSIDKPWDHIRDLWAPPASHVGRGRFNEVGKPVLYVSSDPHTALMETQPRPYEVRVVLLLRKRAAHPVIYVAQIGLEHLPDFYAAQGNFDEVRGGMRAEPILKTFLESRGIYQGWSKQDAFLSEVCTNNYEKEAESAYRLTSEIGKQIQKIRHVDGLQYPTVANGYRGLNLAFPVSVARIHFAPIQAWLLQLGGRIDPPGIAGRRYDGTVLRLGTFEANGTLRWGPRGSWSPDDLHRRMAPPLTSEMLEAARRG